MNFLLEIDDLKDVCLLKRHLKRLGNMEQYLLKVERKTKAVNPESYIHQNYPS